MSMQVKGKFIRLEAGEALTQKKQNGDVVEVIKAVEESGQVKVKANGQEIAIKSQVDGQFLSIEANIDVIESQLAAEVSTRENQFASLQTEVDAVESALTQEVSNRTQGDINAIASANSYTDTKIAALVDAAPALLDTLNELAAALGDDPNFATSIANSVAAVQTAVEAEEIRALAAEADLAADIAAEVDARLQLAEQNAIYLNNLDNALEQETADRTAADGVLQSNIDAEEAARIAGDAAEATARTAAISAEATLRAAGDSSLQAQITTLESDLSAAEAALSAAITAEETARIADVNAEESRALAAEAVLQGQLNTLGAVAHYKEKFVLSTADLAAGYIELSELAKSNSIVASVGRLMIHEGVGEDFTVSVVVAGKTRMTFVGNLVAPSDEQLAVGDVIYVKYMA